MDKTPMLLTYLGKDIREMSREELIEVVQELFAMYENERKELQRERDFAVSLL